MLGPGGYHEKAWKRVWSQIGRLEIVLSRKVYESEEEEMLNSGKISGPEVALRYLGYAYKSYVFAVMTLHNIYHCIYQDVAEISPSLLSEICFNALPTGFVSNRQVQK